jgi:hypothetical protein
MRVAAADGAAHGRKPRERRDLSPKRRKKMKSNVLRMGLAALAALVLPAAVAAQMKPMGLEVRGGLNWAVSDLKNGLGEDGQIGGAPVAAAEQHGWTGSVDLYWTFAQRGAAYIGWNATGFDCKDELCGTDGRLYSAGPELGFKFSAAGDRSFSPWIRAGLLAHKMKFKEGASLEENSVRTPGFEVGVGSDIHIGERFSIVPGLRFYRYNAGWDLGTPGAKRIKKNVGWFQTDLGLQLHLGGYRLPD